MVSVSTLILLTGGLASSVNAKLWGWPNDFALVRGSDLVLRECDGWGDFCDESKYHDFQETNFKPDYSSFDLTRSDWIHFRKDGSAWIDIWHENGDTFNMFESNQDGTVQGQCQVHHGGYVDCGGGRQVRPLLHCWQW